MTMTDFEGHKNRKVKLSGTNIRSTRFGRHEYRRYDTNRSHQRQTDVSRLNSSQLWTQSWTQMYMKDKEYVHVTKRKAKTRYTKELSIRSRGWRIICNTTDSQRETFSRNTTRKVIFQAGKRKRKNDRCITRISATSAAKDTLPSGLLFLK